MIIASLFIFRCHAAFWCCQRCCCHAHYVDVDWSSFQHHFHWYAISPLRHFHISMAWYAMASLCQHTRRLFVALFHYAACFSLFAIRYLFSSVDWLFSFEDALFDIWYFLCRLFHCHIGADAMVCMLLAAIAASCATTPCCRYAMMLSCHAPCLRRRFTLARDELYCHFSLMPFRLSFSLLRLYWYIIYYVDIVYIILFTLMPLWLLDFHFMFFIHFHWHCFDVYFHCHWYLIFLSDWWFHIYYYFHLIMLSCCFLFSLFD